MIKIIIIIINAAAIIGFYWSENILLNAFAKMRFLIVFR